MTLNDNRDCWLDYVSQALVDKEQIPGADKELMPAADKEQIRMDEMEQFRVADMEQFRVDDMEQFRVDDMEQFQAADKEQFPVGDKEQLPVNDKDYKLLLLAGKEMSRVDEVQLLEDNPVHLVEEERKHLGQMQLDLLAAAVRLLAHSSEVVRRA